MHPNIKSFFLETNQSNFLANWKKNRNLFTKVPSIETLIDSFKKVEEYLPKNKLILISDLAAFKPVYISPSVQNILGYSPEEYLSLGHKSYFPPKGEYKFDYLNEFLNCEQQVRMEGNEKSLKPSWGHSCVFGRLQKAKDGTIKKFLIFHRFLLGENFEMPQYDVLHFYEIDHLTNNNPLFWIYISLYNTSKIYQKLFKYDASKQEYKHLLSNREKEILNHIVAGKSSKETANILGISSATVDKHRKNAIQRLGVRDISSLIQVSKICGEL